ncbi:hypothetical protein JJC04_06295 [Flavobacterium covae]|nr:hypothetical protein [Flavobacterium covae]QYS92174.1 hypothetical protein JJC04_06295 [Flavobacterium covae]
MEQREIFNLLANGIIDDLPQGLKFKEAILNIMRLEGVVEFNSYVIDETDRKINLEVSMGYKYAKAVLELYTITQTQPPVHKNWNRAKYTLFPGRENADRVYLG